MKHTTPFLLIILSAACSDESAERWTATTDPLPGGAVVVTNQPPERETPWHLVEDLRIRSANDSGPALCGETKGLLVLGDGRIAVLESQSQEVRLFNAAGEHQATYGGKGSGHAEFRNALGMMLSSSGLIYVPDQANARMTVLHPDRGVIRSYPLQLHRWGFVWHGAMRHDDHVLVPSVSLETRRDLIRIYSPDMVQVDSVLLPPSKTPGVPIRRATSRGRPPAACRAASCRCLSTRGASFSWTGAATSGRPRPVIPPTASRVRRSQVTPHWSSKRSALPYR